MVLAQPLVPVRRVGIDVFLGHAGERIDHAGVRAGFSCSRSCPAGSRPTSLAPAVAILREQHLDVAVAHVVELRRAAHPRSTTFTVPGGHLSASAVNSGQPPIIAPALDAGVRVLRVGDGLGRFLRRLDVVEHAGVVELHVRILGQGFLRARDARPGGWARSGCRRGWRPCRSRPSPWPGRPSCARRTICRRCRSRRNACSPARRSRSTSRPRPCRRPCRWRASPCWPPNTTA